MLQADRLQLCFKSEILRSLFVKQIMIHLPISSAQIEVCIAEIFRWLNGIDDLNRLNDEAYAAWNQLFGIHRVFASAEAMMLNLEYITSSDTAEREISEYQTIRRHIEEALKWVEEMQRKGRESASNQP